MHSSELMRITCSKPKIYGCYRIQLRFDENSTYSSIQLSRWILMSLEDVLVAPADESVILLFQLAEGDDINARVAAALRDECNYTLLDVGQLGSDDVDYIARSLYFSMLCELMKGGRWIYICNDMEYLVTNNFLDSELKSDMSFTSRILNITVDETSVHLTLEIRYMMLSINNVKLEDCENLNFGSEYFTLPSCKSGAILHSIVRASEQSVKFIKNYWFKNHGYVLKEDHLTHVANLRYKTYKAYTYPAILLLKNNIRVLPKSTKVNKMAILDNIISNLKLCCGVKDIKVVDEPTCTLTRSASNLTS